LVAAFVSTVLVLSGFLLGSAAPAVALTGRTLVTATSVSNSVNKSITAHCPAGKQVVGAGGAILNSIGAHGGYGHVLITDIIPNQALTSVTVQGGENSAWASPWKVVAYAMCAPVGAIANLQRVTATAANNGTSDAVKTATAHCPGNLRLYGTGFEINNANGSVLLDKLQPDPGLTEVAGKAVNNGNFAGPWDWTVYAICGAARPTMTLVVAASAFDSNTTHGVTTNPCPAGTTLTGAGAWSEGGWGEVLIDRLSLAITLNTVTVNGWEDQPLGLGLPWDEQVLRAGSRTAVWTCSHGTLLGEHGLPGASVGKYTVVSKALRIKSFG
jgi:hypothetical protein